MAMNFKTFVIYFGEVFSENELIINKLISYRLFYMNSNFII